MIGNERANSVAEYLGQDHRCLDAVFADVKRALAAWDLDSARAGFREFREGLERQMEVEEQVLFPCLERLAGTAAGGSIHAMRMEHGEIRRLLADVAACLEDVAEAGHATPVAELTARIYAHNGKEERIVYPAADRALEKAEVREELLHRWRAFRSARPGAPSSQADSLQ